MHCISIGRLHFGRKARICRKYPANVCKCIATSWLAQANQSCIHAGSAHIRVVKVKYPGYPMLEKRGVLALAGLTSKAMQILSSLALKGIVRWNTDDGKKQTSPTLGAISTVGKS